MKARIEILEGAKPMERACAIVPRSKARATTDETGPFYLYTLAGDGLDQLIAHGPSPSRLSEYAFSCGALSVRHDYDLRAV